MPKPLFQRTGGEPQSVELTDKDLRPSKEEYRRAYQRADQPIHFANDLLQKYQHDLQEVTARIAELRKEGEIILARVADYEKGKAALTAAIEVLDGPEPDDNEASEALEKARKTVEMVGRNAPTRIKTKQNDADNQDTEAAA